MKFPKDFSPPNDAKVYYERSVVNWFEGDIYNIYALPDIEHTLEDATKQMQFIKAEKGDAKVDIILDIRSAPPIGIEARNYYGSQEAMMNLRKRAVIINSVFSKVIANFYLGVFKSSSNSKVFTNIEDAKRWIKSN